jgi:hypothetical protein
MSRVTRRFEQRLGALSYFHGLRHRELATVARLVDPIEVRPGQRFGDYPCHEVTIVESGAAVEGGGPTLLGPGAVVGPTGATALDRVRLLVIGRGALPALLDLAPSLRMALSGNRGGSRWRLESHPIREWTARTARSDDSAAIVHRGVATTRGPLARTIPNRGVPT